MRIFLAALALSLGAPAAVAQTVAVAPPIAAADWKAMITAAKPGDVIDLGDRSVSFASVKLQPASCCVTIRGGRFSGPVTFSAWKNVVIDGGQFEYMNGPTGYSLGILAQGVDNLTLRNISFRGTVQPNGQLSVVAARFINGKNITVEKSRFADAQGAILFQRVDGARFVDNDVSNVREGLDIVASSHVTIARNRIGPFHPSPGDHADGIQFWTTGETTASTDVLIQGNLIVSTPEGRAQGILAGDELGLYKTGAGYARITVRDNVLVGTGWHGISFTAPTEDLLIERNTLLRIDGADAVKNNWIKTVSGRVLNNRAAKFDLAAGVEQAGNDVTGIASADDQAAALSAWTASFRAVPGPTRDALIGEIEAALKSAGDALAQLRDAK
jgi:hypothetical protein